MSKKGMLALLALLAGLGAAYWGIIELEKRGETRQILSRRMFDFDPGNIRAIEIHQLGEAPVAAGRAGEGLWDITKPNPHIDANPVVWERAANTIAALDSVREIATDGDMSQYGLDRPVLRVTAERADGDALRFSFGALDPTQAYRYARFDNEKLLFLIRTEQFHELDRSLDLLRDRRLFKVGEEGISRFEFSRFRAPVNLSGDPARRPEAEESVTVAVEKRPDGRWQVVLPEIAPANQEMAEEFIREIQYSMIVGYVQEPDELEDYGLDPPRSRITIYTGVGSEPQTVLIGIRGDHEFAQGCLYAKTASKPAVFLVDPNVTNVLPQSPHAFREGRLFTRDASKLTAINYTAGDVDIRLENDPEKGWMLAQPASDDTDQVAVSNFISFLRQLSGGNFPDTAPERAGFDNPLIAIRSEFRDEEPAEIFVGARMPDVDRYYARQDNGVTTILNEIEVQALTLTPHDFEKKTLMEFNKGDAVELKLTLDGKDYAFAQLRGRWVVTVPEKHMLSTSADMDPLIAVLSQLRADKKLSGDLSAAEGAGLDAPAAVLTVKVTPDGGEPVTLGPVNIGAPRDDDSLHRYATSTERAGVYLVRQAIMDEIRATVRAVRKAS